MKLYPRSEVVQSMGLSSAPTGGLPSNQYAESLRIGTAPTSMPIPYGYVGGIPQIFYPESAPTEANALYLYRVTVIDSEIANDEAAAEVYIVRARGSDEARLKAVIRADLTEDGLDVSDVIVEGPIGGPLKEIDISDDE